MNFLSRCKNAYKSTALLVIALIIPMFCLTVKTVSAFSYAVLIAAFCLVMLWGFTRLISQVRLKNFFLDRINLIFSIYILFYCISILLNISKININTFILLGSMLVSAIVIFPMDQGTPKKVMIKQLKDICTFIVLISFILGIFSIITYIFSINIQVSEHLYIGMHQNRLWGYVNPNVGSYIAMLSIICAIVLRFLNRKAKKFYKRFLMLNIVIQALYLPLANSRGTIMACCCAGFVLSALLFNKKYTKKITGIYKRYAFSILVGIGIVIGILLYHQLSRFILSYLPPLIEKIILFITNIGGSAGPERLPSFVLTPIDLRLERVASPDISSSRIQMWLFGLNLLKANPLFGIDASHLNAQLMNTFNLEHIHNAYVEILVANGIMGFLALGSAIVYYLFRALRYLLNAVDTLKNYVLNSILFTFVVALLITGMVECHILYWSAILFFVMGCQVYLIKGYEKKKEVQIPFTPVTIIPTSVEGKKDKIKQ